MDIETNYNNNGNVSDCPSFSSYRHSGKNSTHICTPFLKCSFHYFICLTFIYFWKQFSAKKVTCFTSVKERFVTTWWWKNTPTLLLLCWKTSTDREVHEYACDTLILPEEELIKLAMILFRHTIPGERLYAMNIYVLYECSRLWSNWKTRPDQANDS